MGRPRRPHTIDVGLVIGREDQQYRLESVEIETEDATVFLATALHHISRGHHPADIVGHAVFVVVLRHPFESLQRDAPDWPDAYGAQKRAAKTLMRRALSQVSPAVAGFPEWDKIRSDDPVQLQHDEIGPLHWGAFQVSTYRRRLARDKAEYRCPKNFSETTRRSLLESAKHRCERCGSREQLEVDHIIPIGLGGTNRRSHGMVLCATCHREKSSDERKAFGQSVDHAVKIDAYTSVTFEVPSRYLQVLQQRTGWSVPRHDVA